mmetsp:Transcript_37238/g.73112  ORF Transcript_37238/g.73112 Transcript_37238/m.73112 type:complete len:87 (-) Transcript_37238:573-833(-)
MNLEYRAHTDRKSVARETATEPVFTAIPESIIRTGSQRSKDLTRFEGEGRGDGDGDATAGKGSEDLAAGSSDSESSDSEMEEVVAV